MMNGASEVCSSAFHAVSSDRDMAKWDNMWFYIGLEKYNTRGSQHFQISRSLSISVLLGTTETQKQY